VSPGSRRLDCHPRCNVAPSQVVETIISVNGEKRLGPMRWGFVSPTAASPMNASPVDSARDFD
jgi:putative SOS response-associated peptidase YedK